jgi:hypothetical protein
MNIHFNHCTTNGDIDAMKNMTDPLHVTGDEQENVEQELGVEEKKERIYTAGQVLFGNHDESELLASIPINHDEDEDDEASDMDDAERIVERRGHAVLELLQKECGAKDSKLRQDWVSQVVKKRIQSIQDGDVTSNYPSAESCRIFFFPNTGHPTLSDSRRRDWWEVLEYPIRSVAHVNIANGLTGRALGIKHTDGTNRRSHLYTEAHRQLMDALACWPCNPLALSCVANLERMGVLPDADEASARRMTRALELYLAASKCAQMTRELCLKLLQEKDSVIGGDDKFLVEGIILQLCAQVESLDETDDDQSNTDDQREKKKTENTNDEYGPSSVLATSSYMSAILASALGQHSLASCILRRFCSPNRHVTRIHPSVWKATLLSTQLLSSPLSLAPKQAAFVPSVFPGAIPKDLFDTLRRAFRPEGPYWDQSAYDRGVYYSFWTDWPLSSNGSGETTVSNAIEDLVLSHLLPRVQSVLSEEQMKTLKGYEWWVHTRPHGANLGHQLHFDTDEALLEQDGIVDIPMCATVLYLSEDLADATQHGATVLFDQNPRSKQNAEIAWICKPKARSFLVFPGDLLHGVLPCAAAPNEESDLPQPNVKRLRRGEIPRRTLVPPHRLTFMVNFWATRIPDRLKSRRLYGPSGPFPPESKDHSWVDGIRDTASYSRIVEGYDKPFPVFVGERATLPCVSPAWEVIKMNDGNEEEDESLESDIKWMLDYDCDSVELPPSGINQRFFVKNAPEYFHSTLFEK